MARKTKAQQAADSIRAQELAAEYCATVDLHGIAWVPIISVIERRAVTHCTRWLGLAVTEWRTNSVCLEPARFATKG